MATTSTKVNKSQPELTVQQTEVIALLLAGQTQTVAADQVGIAAETISRWKSSDPVFVAAYNAARQELWEANREKLTGLRERAVDTVGDLLDSDHEPTKLKAALSVLDLTDGHPVGPTDAEGVEKQWADAVKAQERAERFDTLLDF